MTNEEINIAIAEACGWKFIPEYCHGEDQPPEFTTVTPDGKHLCGYYPEYCNDLNAMHEAVRIFDYEQLEKFEEHLCDICERANDEAENPAPWRFAVVHATARQRAEALLKTLDLWVE